MLKTWSWTCELYFHSFTLKYGAGCGDLGIQCQIRTWSLPLRNWSNEGDGPLNKQVQRRAPLSMREKTGCWAWEGGAPKAARAGVWKESEVSGRTGAEIESGGWSGVWQEGVGAETRRKLPIREYSRVPRNDQDRFWDMHRWWFYPCANITECTSTNLDGTAHDTPRPCGSPPLYAQPAADGDVLTPCVTVPCMRPGSERECDLFWKWGEGQHSCSLSWKRGK